MKLEALNRFNTIRKRFVSLNVTRLRKKYDNSLTYIK